ncbi:NADH:flavin oxidoreductase [Qingshengfaniella alkalisoli]|uniref:NADH:flavin oxidoreductase n=1 Tax=Qingshengfaniella alkalisoli TaxID=2599296 RepID=A0A5B8IYH0_9RHOB|nr:NADH:flavin oxidoreductase [Qingshengfaniella alkalisoli]QDY70774.1 NADH:flavin oxidoreductase [Qingshengfaniella alkalisoli]
MSNDALLQPYQLNHLTLKNRIMTTSHEPAYPEDGLPKDRYRAYHEVRAKAGVALTMTAGSAVVSKDSPPSFSNVLAYKDEVVPWMRRLSDACHEHGCAVMIQLTHLGRRTRWDYGDWLPSLSAGPDRETAHKAFPKVMEDWDIDRVIADYIDAADRMKEAGLDGIELNAYGHLIDQFWSMRTNRMEAPFGGDLEARQTFSDMLLDRMRERVGPDFIIGIRFTADETVAGGLTEKEGLAIARRLKARGQVDFLNVIRGRLDTDPALTDVIPVQGMKSAPHLDFAGRIKAEIGLPTFHAARIPDVATARHAISAGLLDMVGMTRAHMADPFIVRRIMEKREDDIRPCVGANHCLDRIYQGHDALCIHNAATGRELFMPHEIEPASSRKKIVVVGAGPAGLEAARVAAERGHGVTVFEAQNDPGGQILLQSRTPRRREMISIIDWRMAQCAARDVEFRFNSYAEAADVLAENPDVVIVATGGMPNVDILEHGADLVASSWDLIAGDVKPAQNVLVFDATGDHAALQAVEVAANAGSHVELMTPDRILSSEVMGMTLVPAMRALQDKNVTFTVTYRLMGVERDGNALKAIIGTDYSDHREERSFDQIVVNYGTLPLDEIYFDLKPYSTNHGAVDHDALLAGQPQPAGAYDGQFQLYRIGDAVSARSTHAAIYDALRLVKDI